mmetsp:Transcript_5920/g.10642  ORF Transcript_5920/g.10642 Transcript_5920/m.10642 type:complete len:260 (+) Transcript_5920:562-1341(+)|eukprot:CAMPEP_0184695916 /NCGR_PEP_ID=MMETSP0313-20130426/3381_1 /TAXON_ID=2792 /ORGANISM="Porphyridium aerugineum, Strain SAG 1380-2" /LENGTH=259 /DNA_ID=CAMNT_0027154443 /DNA_START=505 /DNA_END=1284 /DNA_ORIENTATION=-
MAQVTTFVLASVAGGIALLCLIVGLVVWYYHDKSDSKDTTDRDVEQGVPESAIDNEADIIVEDGAPLPPPPISSSLPVEERNLSSLAVPLPVEAMTISENDFEPGAVVSMAQIQKWAPLIESYVSQHLQKGTQCELCSICFEDMEEGQRVRVLRRCSHEFHDECICRWLVRVNRCPLCQRIVCPENASPSTSFRDSSSTISDASSSSSNLSRENVATIPDARHWILDFTQEEFMMLQQYIFRENLRGSDENFEAIARAA